MGPIRAPSHYKSPHYGVYWVDLRPGMRRQLSFSGQGHLQSEALPLSIHPLDESVDRLHARDEATAGLRTSINRLCSKIKEPAQSSLRNSSTEQWSSHECYSIKPRSSYDSLTESEFLRKEGQGLLRCFPVIYDHFEAIAPDVSIRLRSISSNSATSVRISCLDSRYTYSASRRDLGEEGKG